MLSVSHSSLSTESSTLPTLDSSHAYAQASCSVLTWLYKDKAALATHYTLTFLSYSFAQSSRPRRLLVVHSERSLLVTADAAMVDWGSPEVVASCAYLTEKLIVFFFGFYCYHFISTLRYLEIPLIRRRLKFQWTFIPYFGARYSLLTCQVAFQTGLCGSAFETVAFIGSLATIFASENLLIRSITLWRSNRYAVAFLVLIGLGHWILLIVIGLIPLVINWTKFGKSCLAYGPARGPIPFFMYMLVFTVIALLRHSAARSSRLWITLYNRGILYFFSTFVVSVPMLVLTWLDLNDFMSVMFAAPSVTISVIASSGAVTSLLRLRDNPHENPPGECDGTFSLSDPLPISESKLRSPVLTTNIDSTITVLRRSYKLMTDHIDGWHTMPRLVRSIRPSTTNDVSGGSAGGQAESYFTSDAIRPLIAAIPAQMNLLIPISLYRNVAELCGTPFERLSLCASVLSQRASWFHGYDVPTILHRWVMGTLHDGKRTNIGLNLPLACMPLWSQVNVLCTRAQGYVPTCGHMNCKSQFLEASGTAALGQISTFTHIDLNRAERMTSDDLHLATSRPRNWLRVLRFKFMSAWSLLRSNVTAVRERPEVICFPLLVAVQKHAVWTVYSALLRLRSEGYRADDHDHSTHDAWIFNQVEPAARSARKTGSDEPTPTICPERDACLFRIAIRGSVHPHVNCDVHGREASLEGDAHIRKHCGHEADLLHGHEVQWHPAYAASVRYYSRRMHAYMRTVEEEDHEVICSRSVRPWDEKSSTTNMENFEEPPCRKPVIMTRMRCERHMKATVSNLERDLRQLLKIAKAEHPDLRLTLIKVEILLAMISRRQQPTKSGHYRAGKAPQLSLRCAKALSSVVVLERGLSRFER
ncbi:hypothetical protein NM688_g1413 [Phlebia brevispora]|uniref:Uncharacterized protein n=1 Tax=Phlebia brevispora TaxID=194682 RepID=A0ACC1TBN7_9APHY|nr:hypothetical protein NM688_g1413 [Phlebia brevispora]